MPHRKMLIDTFINSIYLYDDKMLLTFNFKDATKTITFDDVNDAPSKYGSGAGNPLNSTQNKIRVVQFLLLIPYN